MDITRVPNDQKLYLSRFYFRVGFLCLPFVWAVNACWFYNEAFNKPPYDEQQQIKRYVKMSGVGAAIWMVAILVWLVVYQVYRADWGVWGDDISFIIPMGRK